MKKVSVVVAAYNAHDTLARCLSCLVNQTLQDIEIIVVNDASTDDTWEIMQRCEAQFPDKMVIINCDVNSGPGGARSIGLDAASGEYIGISDADDYVSTSMYEQLYKRAMETGADIVDSGIYKEQDDNAFLTVSDSIEGELDANKRSTLISSGGYLVTKIFKNELFNDPPVRMPANISTLEDLEIFIYMFLRAKSIASVEEVLYNYCNTEGSCTKTLDLNKYYNAAYTAMERTYEKCHNLSTYEGSKEAVEFILTNVYSFAVNRCLYEQIAKLGAASHNVTRYFDNINAKEKEMLQNLANLKSKIITLPYYQNKEVINRISDLDIEIMKECDRRFYC